MFPQKVKTLVLVIPERQVYSREMVHYFKRFIFKKRKSALPRMGGSLFQGRKSGGFGLPFLLHPRLEVVS